MRAKVLALIIGCFGWIDVTAQEWKTVPDAEHRKSVVHLKGSNMVEGSGVVIKKIKDSDQHEGFYLGLILTASHCVEDLSVFFDVKFYDGTKTVKNRPVKDLAHNIDYDNDIAIIRALIPNNVTVTPLSLESPKCNDVVILSGYGAGEVRHWSAKYGGKKLMSEGHVIFSWGIQGDSGGPVVYKGKVIGVICYGSGIRKLNSGRIVISPINASNVSRIKDYVDGYKE
jgi:hypothetical protein